jgi:carnitine-CoA ligase
MTHQTYDQMRPTFAEQRDWTLPQVLRARAASHADDVYLDVPEEGATYSYARTLDLSERIAATLLDHAEIGDRVLLMAPNSAAFVLSWFGAAVAGMVEVPINTAYRGRFLEHQVTVAAPRVAVIDAAYAERFVASRDACGAIERFYVLGGASEVEDACGQLVAHGWVAEPWDRLVADAPRDALPDVRHHDPVGILFTSGTTGPSKGVTMSHAHMYFFADECVSLTRLTDADTYLVMGPLFHGNAQFLAAYPALIAGARFVLHERFTASRWIERIRDSGATVTNFVGVMMDFVWKQPRRDDDAENNLRCVFAAPTAPYVDEFRERFGIEAFVEVFGLTETSMPILSPYGQPRPTGAAGLLDATHFDVRLVDPETDEEVPDGEMGELVVRPRLPWITTLGYYGMPDRTVEAFRNLWFHTGDGMRRDADGWFYFVDRLKDALRRRGENISSYEVESPILEHPEVLECAVVAVPADHAAGEDEVLAAVVTAPGSELTAADLWEWCDERIPAFAVPRYLRFVDALPQTPSGKIRKLDLRGEGASAPGVVDRTTVGD